MNLLFRSQADVDKAGSCCSPPATRRSLVLWCGLPATQEHSPLHPPLPGPITSCLNSLHWHAGVVLGSSLHMLYHCMLEHPGFQIRGWSSWQSSLERLPDAHK